MAFLWGMVFSQAIHSITLGLCMGLLMGITFGLFDSDKGGKEDEYQNGWRLPRCSCLQARPFRSPVTIISREPSVSLPQRVLLIPQMCIAKKNEEKQEEADDK